MNLKEILAVDIKNFMRLYQTGTSTRIILPSVNLQEVFDTIIPVDKWHNIGDSIIGDITIDNSDYQIVIETFIYKFNDVDKTVINLAFDKIVDGKASGDLSLDTKSTSKVFGAILNAALQKIEQYHCDVIVFMAANNVEKRMRVYNWIARRVAMQLGSYLLDIPVGIGKMSMVMKAKITDAELELIKQHFITKHATR